MKLISRAFALMVPHGFSIGKSIRAAINFSKYARTCEHGVAESISSRVAVIV
jgi:hypothetical protein